MPLSLLATRSPSLAGWKCLRCFSSSAPAQAAGDILDLLRYAQGASSSTAQPLQGNITTLIGREAGLTQTPSRELLESERRSQYQRQIFRKWNPGDVYAPHDLSGQEQKKWKTGRKRPQQDAFDVLGINPIQEYKNFTMMSEYMTEMGRIKHSKDTGLRPKNQRKVAKAIRRAIGLGLMPSVHRHPLVLKKSSPYRFL